MKASALILGALLVLPLAAPAYAQDGKDDNYGHHERHDLWSKLPEAKRKALHEAMEQAHKQNEAMHQEAHKLHEKLSALFTAPTFDKDAYMQDRQKLDDLEAKMKVNMEAAYTSAAAQFTADERKILEKLHKMRHYHGGWDHAKSHEQSSKEPEHTPPEN